jgi:hypothetical protein
MKRFILPLLILLFVGSLFAVESAPSEVVGYFKLNSAAGSWSPLTLPFNYADISVGNVIGDQFADADEISDIATGLNTVYYDGFGWFGDLEEMEYGKAYWVYKNEANPTSDFFVLGKVGPSQVELTILGNSWTPWGLNEARDIAVADLFTTGPSDGDEISDISTGLNTVYYEGFGWFGDLEFIEPTHAYWYVTAESGFSWTYQPDTRGTHGFNSNLRTRK